MLPVKSRYGGVGEDWMHNQYKYYLCNWDSILIFSYDDAKNYLAHIQGRHNAFVIHFKFCLTRKVLVPLSYLSFNCFTDLCGVHQNFWSESYSWAIFSSLDYVREKMWRVLCQYGSSQGNFPKNMLKIPFPAIFTLYFCKSLHDAGVQSLVVASEPQCWIKQYFMYRIVSINQSYRYFYL
jgi:hypothetical protein